MAAVWIRARAELRARWRAWLALALLTGLFAGSVIALAAGARRTATAYPRFLEQTRAADIWVPNLPFGPIFARFDLDEVAAHPMVAESVRARLAFSSGDSDRGLVGADPAYGRTFNIARMLDGRLPEVEAPHEVSLPFDMARSIDAAVGDTLSWALDAPGGSIEVDLEVVGIHATASDFPPLGDTLNAIGTAAFFERYGDRVFSFEIEVVRLVDGPAGTTAFLAELDELGGGRLVFTLSGAEQTEDVQSAIGLQVSALWAITLVAGLSVLLVLGQAIARQSFLDAGDDPVLRSLGMSGRTLFAVSAARGVLVAGAAVVIAVATAAGLSPLLPRGVARIAEPHPGFAFDATAIGLGTLALLLVVVFITVAAGLQRVRRPVLAEERERPSRIARMLGRGHPATVTGVRFALEPGRGASAVPVRTTVASIALGMAALIGTLIFAGNIEHLLGTPRLYGEVWDDAFAVEQSADSDASSLDLSGIAAELAARDDVAAVSLGSQGIPLALESVPVNGLSMEQLKGVIGPPVVEGRVPAHDDEVVVGVETLKRIDARVGDRVHLSVKGTSGTLEVTIVGTGVLPPLGTQARFGEGVFLSYTLLEMVAAQNEGLRGIVPPPDEIYVIYADDADPVAVEREIRATYGADARRGLEVSLGPDFQGIPVSEIVSFGQVRALPFVLAGLLAALAAATLVNALITGVRRRRRELAVLRTLGFVRAQVRRAVRWQAVTLAVVTFGIALPAGVALGRWAWLWFARTSGVVGEVVIPAHIALVGPAALAITLLVALVPARPAARVEPAVVLRKE